MALFGYDQGVFGGVNVTPDYLTTMGFSETSSVLSTVTAIYDIGSFFGAILAMWYGERFGRKITILTGSAIMTVGAILQISAFSVAQMMVARIISGIGNGLNTATAPVWQSETSKANMRGKLVVIEMICNIGGFSLSNWITYGFSFLNGGVSWRFPIAFQLLFLFVLFATVPWLPESPRWLMAHGRIDEAERVIADLESSTLDDPYVITQSKEVQVAVEIERQNNVPWSDLLRNRTGDKAGTKTIRRLLLGMGTQAMQQLGGINVTSYFLPTVLTVSVGLDNNLARLLAACNSVSYLIFGSLAIPVVENGGRRFLMIFGACGQFVCYLTITILLRYNEKSGYAHQSQVAEASIAFFFLYYVFFGFGWQGVPWLYPTEINSLGMRTKGAALGTATNWIVNFMVVEITPPGIDSLHWQFYIIWTVFNFSFIPIVYLFYPETAGRTLEDMDRFFAGHGGVDENGKVVEGHPPPLLVYKDKDAIARRRPQKFVDREFGEVRRNSSAVEIEAWKGERSRRRSSQISTAESPTDEKSGAGTREDVEKADAAKF
ncbi:MAG: hypothetical protein M1828_004748 [Chrysothrix sp. TS-e1954]|nr:MAG: hypothetical protein M1828_004748 [Chrysothrix sp. TS-e1954]